MAQPNSKATAWVKKGLTVFGFLIFLAGLHWFLDLRPTWPRSMTDHIPQPLLEAAGVIIGGLYLVSRGR
ncbi:MAG TPA: hypothetical protein VHY22_14265 [Chthoniobacteraceae bacterium]|jgi:hypothetical protein|nr:hypothetical protein [Chthoniobacteraceae bacterium]